MHLKNIIVANFKNISEATTDFSPRLNCLIGDNGAGKTNILDAVYYLSFTKSFFNASDNMNIRHNEAWFMLNGIYSRSGEDTEVGCNYRVGQKKQVKRDTKAYRRMADHIGLLPLVMVSPNDSVLILGGSDERRKFIDSVVSQFNSGYLNDLLRYNRVLLQRNNLLKQEAGSMHADSDMMEVYDMQLVETGSRIFENRKKFIEELNPVFQKYYTAISQGVETVGLRYESDLHSASFDELLSQAREKDRMVQYTTAGIHKDDLIMVMGDYPIRKVGSQGQQKTYLVSLKLAQFEFIANASGIKPILLLDDIFDKLDKKRVEQIVKMVSDEKFGQIFITDTNREHLDTILRSLHSDYRIFKVAGGHIMNIE